MLNNTETNHQHEIELKNVNAQNSDTVIRSKSREKPSHHRKREKAAVKDVNVGTNEAVTVLNNTETSYQHEMELKNVDAQNLDAVILLKSRNKKHQRQEKKKNDEMKSDLPLASDGLKLKLNEEAIGDRRQETLVRGDLDNTMIDSVTNNDRMPDVTIFEQNQQYTERMDNTKDELIPIVGYAEEPLLPLAEACAPLIDIIHDLMFYVQMALDGTPAVPPDELTVDESAAIRLYTIEWTGPHRSLYSMLNYTLKNCDRQDLVPYFRYMKLFLTALVKLPCIPPLTVWRGVTKDLSAEFPPGTPVTWWAFSSTTTELTVLENKMYLGDAGSRTLFSVEVINGRTIRAHSHFVTEDEILLLPGTHMIVQSLFSPASELHIIHLKQVIPEQMLLEPPFEGYLNNLLIYFKLSYFYI